MCILEAERCTKGKLISSEPEQCSWNYLLHYNTRPETSLASPLPIPSRLSDGLKIRTASRRALLDRVQEYLEAECA